jgi:hypothetical protein
LSACPRTAIRVLIAITKLIISFATPDHIASSATKAFGLAATLLHRRLSADGGLDFGIL